MADVRELSPEEIWKEAKAAGDTACADHPDVGAVGFAWITIHPARGKMVSYLKAEGIGGKAAHGGYQIWADYKGQAVEGNCKWAVAVALVFKAHGFEVYWDSRLD